MTKVAVVQAGSVPFDPDASVKKAVDLIAECAREGATTAVFPEAFVGGYPKGLRWGAAMGSRTPEGRAEFATYSAAAIDLRGPQLAELAEASREHGVFVVMGVIEKQDNTLYCTVAMISPEHGLINHHRKLMPTGSERLVWGFGDGSTMEAVDSPAGRLGAVICWENYMPLLRYSMYAQGLELYCAPTVDDRDTWQHTMRHIAVEGRVFVLSACQYITRDAYPHDYDDSFGRTGEDVMIRGGSVIIDPLGEVLAGPVFGEETILYADVDLDAKDRSHLDFDPVGHYARPDVFHLTVNRTPRPAVTSITDVGTTE